MTAGILGISFFAFFCAHNFKPKKHSAAGSLLSKEPVDVEDRRHFSDFSCFVNLTKGMGSTTVSIISFT